MSRRQIEDKLRILSDKVSKNVDIVDKTNVLGQMLLHISSDTKLKVMTPFISQRQATSEDRTVARICTAPTIVGCIKAYSNSIYKFLYGFDKKEIKETDYLGGFIIYSLDFEYALKPSDKLVFDSSLTDEHWLISYNEETVNYKPQAVGKMFIRSVTYTGVDKETPVGSYMFYVEVYDKELYFNAKRSLAKGFYRITGPIDSETKNFKQDKPFEIVQVDSKEYMQAKLESASLLSFKEPSVITKW